MYKLAYCSHSIPLAYCSHSIPFLLLLRFFLHILDTTLVIVLQSCDVIIVLHLDLKLPRFIIRWRFLHRRKLTLMEYAGGS